MRTVKDYVAQHGLSSLQRPRYSAGLLLEDEDLTAAVDYTREMTRLLFSSFFGCGVICGLDVKAVLTCNRTRVEVSVSKGIALDGRGNPIYIPKGDKVVFDADCDPPPPTLWVTVCYTEKCCRPRDTSCAPDDESHVVHTRSHDGYEIRLYWKRPSCACTCEPKPPDDTGHKDADDCCDDESSTVVSSSTAPSSSTATQQSASTPATETKQAAVHQGGIIVSPERPKYEERLCECYREHYLGVCDCDCGCNCVVIAKIDVTTTDKKDDKTGGYIEVTASTDKEPALLVDRTVVRWIRPVLTGYSRCELPRQSTTATTTSTGRPYPVRTDVIP
jgi:hypothetical protein